MVTKEKYDQDKLMLQDIEQRIHTVLPSIVEEYGDKCSLAIPAVLLKLTLQIYKEVYEDEDAISHIIMSCLNELDELPPLMAQRTIH